MNSYRNIVPSEVGLVVQKFVAKLKCQGNSKLVIYRTSEHAC